MRRNNWPHAVCAVLLVLALGCGGDDDDPVVPSILGWWREDLEPAGNDYYWYFKADGTLYYDALDEMGDVDCYAEDGEWSIQDDNRLVVSWVTREGALPVTEDWYFRVESFGDQGPDRLLLYERATEPDDVYYTTVRVSAPQQIIDECERQP
jgi:hypothetical protein